MATISSRHARRSAGAACPQDLDPLSQDELDARIAALEAEIARVRAHMEAASRHRSAADALFKR
jgi:uncharacterized small protein (DUF1192 family)